MKDVKTAGIKGIYAPQEAIEKLIEGQQLKPIILSPNVIALKAVKIPSTTTAISASEGEFEELTVVDSILVGSRIGDSNAGYTASIDVINSPTLELSGAQSLIDFFKFTPAVTGNSTSTSVSNGGNGTSTVTLRGLPANNTLVLINGQRVAFNGLSGDSVDLNSIPPSAIERIEILKDGASAYYGSDAIAGVVNIVLRNQQEGFTVEQYYGQTYYEDLRTRNTIISGGHKTGDWSFYGNANFLDQSGINSRDRDFSASADARNQGGSDTRSSTTPTARISLNNGQTVTLDVNTDRGGISTLDERSESARYRDVTEEDLFNYLQYTSSTSPIEQTNLYLSGQYTPSSTFTFQANAAYSQTESTINLAPLPLSTGRNQISPITVSSENRFNPFEEDITDIRRRVLEAGNRVQEFTSESTRFNISADGSHHGINWSSAAYWSKSEANRHSFGIASGNRVRRALGPSRDCQGREIDGCTPLNLFGSPGSITQEQLDYILTENELKGFTRIHGLHTAIDWEVGEWWSAGPVLAAAGIDWRMERIRSRSSAPDDDFLIGQNDVSDTNGSRQIQEVFAEIHIPILKHEPYAESLDLNIALRASQYSDFGNNTSPHLSIGYSPTPNWVLRANFSKGFRAPSLDELQREGLQTQAALNDPCANPDNVEVLPGCTQQSDPTVSQFLTIFQGDEDLQPEKSINRSAGIVWQSTVNDNNDLKISADYFSISQKDVINTNPQFIVNENAETGRYRDLVQRNAEGDITKIFAPHINIGQLDVQGIDLSLNYQHTSKHRGVFNYTFNAVNLHEFTEKIADGETPRNLVGFYVDSAAEGYGTIPKWKASAGFEWRKNKITLAYNMHYLDSLKETPPRFNQARKIESWTTHNAQLNIKNVWKKNLNFTFGIDNITNEEPPFVDSSINDNYDPYSYNAKQMFWYLKLGYRFQ
ncbi:TonB-dependent receptor [Marinibactrum halimedae]|uniref:TonB-dependent receptor n=1 Tax=Marinibactrum halimedae TaxID=1444977 RepID=A0AA37T4L7_9GAMM|nr:TonB-dependent receptor [Marinibactrum halimedae]